MLEPNESLHRRVIWHIAKIPIVAIVIFLLIASGPLPFFRGGPIGCTCQECEFLNWYDSLGGGERLWYNLGVIIPLLLS